MPIPNPDGTQGKDMKLQISSGQGPVECELAVAKFADSLCKEFKDSVIMRIISGYHDGCYKSVIIESKEDLSFLDGSVKWICQSPFRPNHKRKNWFVDVSPLKSFDCIDVDEELIRFDTFRSGGKGGQNEDGRRMTERGNWLEHTRLIRGNELRVYEGMEFKRSR